MGDELIPMSELAKRAGVPLSTANKYVRRHPDAFHPAASPRGSRFPVTDLQILKDMYESSPRYNQKPPQRPKSRKVDKSRKGDNPARQQKAEGRMLAIEPLAVKATERVPEADVQEVLVPEAQIDIQEGLLEEAQPATAAADAQEAPLQEAQPATQQVPLPEAQPAIQQAPLQDFQPATQQAPLQDAQSDRQEAPLQDAQPDIHQAPLRNAQPATQQAPSVPAPQAGPHTHADSQPDQHAAEGLDQPSIQSIVEAVTASFAGDVERLLQMERQIITVLGNIDQRYRFMFDQFDQLNRIIARSWETQQMFAETINQTLDRFKQHDKIIDMLMEHSKKLEKENSRLMELFSAAQEAAATLHPADRYSTTPEAPNTASNIRPAVNPAPVVEESRGFLRRRRRRR